MDDREPTFSFSLSAKRGLLKPRVGISSIDVIREAVLVIYVAETMGITEPRGLTDGPFPVTRTAFFLKLDSDSSFLHLIFAYMSLLNFVVISARRKHLTGDPKCTRVELTPTRKILTFFSLNANLTKNVKGRVRTEVVKGKGLGINQVVPVLNHLNVPDCGFNALLMPALKLRSSLNYAK